MNKTIVAEKVAGTTAMIGSGGAMFFGLTANELAALIGAAVAIAGFLASMWFKWQHLRLVRGAIVAPQCSTCPLNKDADA